MKRPRPVQFLSLFVYAWILMLCVLSGYGCGRSKKVIGNIGDFQITLGDIEYKAEIVKVFYPKEFENKPKNHALTIAYKQFFNSIVNAQILKHNGFALDQNALLAEEKRIEKDSQDRVSLAKIKKIFGRDHDAYLRVFILPTLADRSIYFDFFLKNTSLHQNSFREALGFIQAVNKNKIPIEDIITKNKLKRLKLWVSKEHGLENEVERKKRLELKKNKIITSDTGSAHSNAPTGPGGRIRAQLEAEQAEMKKTEKEHYYEIARQTKKGALFGSVIDYQSNWSVVRFLGKNPTTHELQFEIFPFPKTDFSQWFETNKKALPITAPAQFL